MNDPYETNVLRLCHVGMWMKNKEQIATQVCEGWMTQGKGKIKNVVVGLSWW